MADESPFFHLREKAVRDSFDVMDKKMLTPWAFFKSGNPISITNFRGDSVNYGGIEFEGSPRQVYWNRFFTPCLEDTIVQHFEESVRQCRESQYFDPRALDETATLLRKHIRAFLDKMAKLDQTLRARSHSDPVARKDVSDEVSAMNALIDSHLAAGRALIRHARPSWLEKNRWWLAAVIAAVVGGIFGSIPGFIALLR
ncbi:MAG TPA: hypothetical protein VM325_15275 [Alphaproteobacteria bacterium]|nr:hypothetical protein [Alphaproteobacteria bacterium]